MCPLHYFSRLQNFIYWSLYIALPSRGVNVVELIDLIGLTEPLGSVVRFPLMTWLGCVINVCNLVSSQLLIAKLGLC